MTPLEVLAWAGTIAVVAILGVLVFAVVVGAAKSVMKRGRK